MKKPNNPSAFPLNEFAYNMEHANGMTLRDYFAAKVMNGIVSNNEMWRSMCMDKQSCTRNKESDTIEDYVAQECYKLADAMLKERSK